MKKIVSGKKVAIVVSCSAENKPETSENGSSNQGGIEEIKISTELLDFLILNPICGRSDYTGLPGVKQGLQSSWRSYQYYPRRSSETLIPPRQISEEQQRKFAEARLQRQQRQEEKLRKKQERSAANRERKRLAFLEITKTDDSDDTCDKEESNVIISSPQKKQWHKSCNVRKSCGIKSNGKGPGKPRKDRADLFYVLTAMSKKNSKSPSGGSRIMKLESLINEIASVSYVPPLDLNLEYEEEKVLKELLKLDDNCFSTRSRNTAPQIKQGKTEISDEANVSVSDSSTPDNTDFTRLPIRATLVKSSVRSNSSNEMDNEGETWSIVSSSYRKSSVKAVADSSTEKRTRRKKRRVNYIEWEEYDDLNDDDESSTQAISTSVNEVSSKTEYINSVIENSYVEVNEAGQTFAPSIDNMSSSSTEQVSSSAIESNFQDRLNPGINLDSCKHQVKPTDKSQNKDKTEITDLSLRKDSSQTKNDLSSYQNASHYNSPMPCPTFSISLSPPSVKNPESQVMTLTTANSIQPYPANSLPSASNLISMFSQPAPNNSGENCIPYNFLTVGHETMTADYLRGGLFVQKTIPNSSSWDAYFSTSQGFYSQDAVNNPISLQQAQGNMPILSSFPPSQPVPLSVNPQSSVPASSLYNQLGRKASTKPSMIASAQDFLFSPSAQQMPLNSSNTSLSVSYPPYNQHPFPVCAPENVQGNSNVCPNVQTVDHVTRKIVSSSIHEKDPIINPINSNSSFGTTTPRFSYTPNVTVGVSQEKTGIMIDSRNFMSGQIADKTLFMKQCTGNSSLKSPTLGLVSSYEGKLVPDKSISARASGIKRNLPVSGATDQSSPKVVKMMSTKEKSLKCVDDMLNSLGNVASRRSTDKKVKAKEDSHFTTSSAATNKTEYSHFHQSKKDTSINSKGLSELSSPCVKRSQPSNILLPPPAHSKTLPSSLVYSVTSHSLLDSEGSYHSSLDSSQYLSHPPYPPSQSQPFSKGHPTHPQLTKSSNQPPAQSFPHGLTHPSPFNPSHIGPSYTGNRLPNTSLTKQVSSQDKVKGKRLNPIVPAKPVSKTNSILTSSYPSTFSNEVYVNQHIQSQLQKIHDEQIRKNQVRQPQPTNKQGASKAQSSSPLIRPPQLNYLAGKDIAGANAFALFNLRPPALPTTSSSILPPVHQNFTGTVVSKEATHSSSMAPQATHLQVHVCEPSHATFSLIASKTTVSVNFTSSMSSAAHSQTKQVSHKSFQSQPDNHSNNKKVEAYDLPVKDSASQGCHQNQKTNPHSVKMEALRASSPQDSEEPSPTPNETIFDRRLKRSRSSSSMKFNSFEVSIHSSDNAALQREKLTQLAKPISTETSQTLECPEFSASPNSSYSTLQKVLPPPSPAAVTSLSSHDMKNSMLISEDSEGDGCDYRSDEECQTMDVKSCVTKSSSHHAQNHLHTDHSRRSQQIDLSVTTTNSLRSEPTASATFSTNITASKSVLLPAVPSVITTVTMSSISDASLFSLDRSNVHLHSSQFPLASLHQPSTASIASTVSLSTFSQQLANIIPSSSVSQQLSSIVSRVKSEVISASRISSNSPVTTNSSKSSLTSSYAKSTELLTQNLPNDSCGSASAPSVLKMQSLNKTRHGINDNRRSSSCLSVPLASASLTSSSSLPVSSSLMQYRDVKPSLSDLKKAFKTEREESEGEEEDEYYSDEEEEEFMDVKPFMAHTLSHSSSLSRQGKMTPNWMVASTASIQDCNAHNSSASLVTPSVGTGINIDVRNETSEDISPLSKTSHPKTVSSNQCLSSEINQTIVSDSYYTSEDNGALSETSHSEMVCLNPCLSFEVNQTVASNSSGRVSVSRQTGPSSNVSSSMLSVLSSAPSLSSQLLPIFTKETTLPITALSPQPANDTSHYDIERSLRQKTDNGSLSLSKSSVFGSKLESISSPLSVSRVVSPSTNSVMPVSTKIQNELNTSTTSCTSTAGVTLSESCSHAISTKSTLETDALEPAQLSFDTIVSPACTSCIVTVTNQTSDTPRSSIAMESKPDGTLQPSSVSARHDSVKEKPASHVTSSLLSCIVVSAPAANAQNSILPKCFSDINSIISEPSLPQTSKPFALSIPKIILPIVTSCTTLEIRPSIALTNTATVSMDDPSHYIRDNNSTSAVSISIEELNDSISSRNYPDHCMEVKDGNKENDPCLPLPLSSSSESLSLGISVNLPISVSVCASQSSAPSHPIVKSAVSHPIVSSSSTVNLTNGSINSSNVSPFPGSEKTVRESLSLPHFSVSTVQIVSEPFQSTQTENDTQITIGQSNLISNLIRIKTELSEDMSQSDSQSQMLDSGILLSGKEFCHPENDNFDGTKNQTDGGDAAASSELEVLSGTNNISTPETPVKSIFTVAKSDISPSKTSFLANLVESHAVKLRAAQESLQNLNGGETCDKESSGTVDSCQPSAGDTSNALTEIKDVDNENHRMTSTLCSCDDTSKSLASCSVTDQSAGNGNEYTVVIAGHIPNILSLVKNDHCTKVEEDDKKSEMNKANSEPISLPVDLTQDETIIIIDAEDDCVEQTVSNDMLSSDDDVILVTDLAGNGINKMDCSHSETEMLKPGAMGTGSEKVQNKAEVNQSILCHDAQTVSSLKLREGNGSASTSFIIANRLERQNSVSSSSVTTQSMDISHPTHSMISLEDTASTISSMSSHSIGSNVTHNRCINAIGSWPKEKVSAWLKKNKLDKICLNLSNLDGPGLQRMVFECHRDHQVFYSRVKKSLGLSMFQTLVIIRCLKSLIHQDDDSDM